MTTTAPSGPPARARGSGRLDRVGNCSTWLKYGSARAARSPAGSERAFEDSVATRVRRAPRAPRASAPGRLSARIEQTSTYSPLRQPRQEVADAGEVVGAVPDLERLVAAALEPAGERDVLRGVRVDGAAEERLGRRGREREVAAARSTTTLPAPFSRASRSHSGSPSTTVAPGWTTASFSAAIASRVSPSTSMWSSATFVSTTTRVRRTFVASWRPPSPASTTATSTLGVGEREQRGGGQRPRTASRRARRPAAARARPRARSRPRRRRRGSARSSRGRAARGTRRRAARRRRAAPRSSASSSTCRSCRRRGPPGSAAAGRRARASSARIRSSPKPSAGHGLSDATQSVAERIELAPVALELLALGLDDVAARVRDEALVREHLLARARSPSASRARSASTFAVRLARAPAVTTASKIRCSSPSSCDAHAAAAEDRRPPPARASSASRVGRVRRRPPPATARRSGATRARAGATRSPRSRAASPGAAASAAARARRAPSPARRRSPSRGLIASRYQSQKSSKVRW